MLQLSVYIIAYNEEDKIRTALESVSWADEVVLVDSNSNDKTVEIAKSLGAIVVQEPFQGFGELRNKAIGHCSHEWVFSLDADERCTNKVKLEIKEILSNVPEVDAYYIPRKNIFMGRLIKYSGFYPDYRQPQLFRKNSLVFENDSVHERYRIITEKPVLYFKNAICQEPFLSFSELLQKANRYSSLGAEQLGVEGNHSSVGKAFSRGLWAFFQLYFIKRGFMDGSLGFVLAFGNFLSTFYKYAKLWENKQDTKNSACENYQR